MNFVFPQFFWAVSALSIPIIIHLFNFRRTKRIYFSNTRFLKQIKEETTQKRKLKQLLILASRLLFLFFLVLAFAQPFLPAKEQITSGRSVIIYLDNSYSMSALVSDKVRALDAGSSFVLQIVDLFPAETRYKLLTNDFAPFSNSFKTKNEIIDLISSVRLSPISRSFKELTTRMNVEAKSAYEIFFISDFQKSTLGVIESSQIDSIHQWHMVPVALEKTSNIYVDSVYLENPFVIGGERNALRIRLKNTANRNINDLVTRLIINDLQYATGSVSFESGNAGEINFDIASGLTGMNRAKISFNDFPTSFDNDFYFTLNFTEKINIVEIKDRAHSNYVEKVFSNREIFNYRGFESGNIDHSSFNQADLVVVNGLNALDASLQLSLNAYLQAQGTLLFFPGLEPDINSYQHVLSNYRLSFWKNPEQAQVELEKPDVRNPFFENIFEEAPQAMAMPKAFPKLLWGTDRSSILRFKTGEPFLSQNNKIFLASSPLHKSFTDFYNHAIFVPVMYRIAASGKRLEQHAYYSLNQSMITLRTDTLIRDVPVRLAGAQEIIPAQRKVMDRLFMELPKLTMVPGFYYALQQNDTLDLLAFNLNREESLLDQPTTEEIQTTLGGLPNVNMYEGSSPEIFSNEIKERYLGTPLWKHAIILALLFLLVEIGLIRFMK